MPSIEHAPDRILQTRTLPAPDLGFSHGDAQRAAFQLSFFCRMLFSALVDADFLATEASCSPRRAGLRRRRSVTIQALTEQLNRHIERFKQQGQPDANEVFRCRQEVLQACRLAATENPGLFSLTVPTGGGKTLSSLAFALEHARNHGHRRVVYAIPFTSIIEQTADVFREVFTPQVDVVLEHHSNLDAARDTPRSRIASENWAAEIVVTTNVQFFESLFASRTSRCRKLHRIAGSVVILDEAQTLPVGLLEPCLAVLRELATDYGCTIVLCTATQPAITRQASFDIGLEGVREIVPNPSRLYRQMKRVDVQFGGRLADDELAHRLAPHGQFCASSTRGPMQPHCSSSFGTGSRNTTAQGCFT